MKFVYVKSLPITNTYSARLNHYVFYPYSQHCSTRSFEHINVYSNWLIFLILTKLWTLHGVSMPTNSFFSNVESGGGDLRRHSTIQLNMRRRSIRCLRYKKLSYLDQVDRLWEVINGLDWKVHIVMEGPYSTAGHGMPMVLHCINKTGNQVRGYLRRHTNTQVNMRHRSIRYLGENS